MLSGNGSKHCIDILATYTYIIYVISCSQSILRRFHLPHPHPHPPPQKKRRKEKRHSYFVPCWIFCWTMIAALLSNFPFFLSPSDNFGPIILSIKRFAYCTCPSSMWTICVQIAITLSYTHCNKVCIGFLFSGTVFGNFSVMKITMEK